ncbi:DUF6456 domain-containing protein [Alsobacter sp. R-9]
MRKSRSRAVTPPRSLRPGPLRARHLDLHEATLDVEGTPRRVLLDGAESPLAWLRRRRGTDGLPLVGDAAFAAGERLRADIARAGLQPRMTMDWTRPPGGGRRGPADVSDVALDARQRVQDAAAAVGRDMAGLLIDVCGFLKGLETVERERRWPARSAKVVLLIALDRLAAHYGLADEVRGPAAARSRSWMAPDARPTMG